jgi:hypothetical protein
MRRREEMKKNIVVQRAPDFFGGIPGIAPELGFMQYPARSGGCRMKIKEGLKQWRC